MPDGTVIFPLARKWYSIRKKLAKRITLRQQYHAAKQHRTRRQANRTAKRPDALHLVFLLVGEGGFEPPKALLTDLQSAPFGHSGIPPYLVAGILYHLLRQMSREFLFYFSFFAARNRLGGSENRFSDCSTEKPAFSTRRCRAFIVKNPT